MNIEQARKHSARMLSCVSIFFVLFFENASARAAADADSEKGSAWIKKPDGHLFEDLYDKPRNPLSVAPLTQTLAAGDGRIIHMRSIEIADTKTHRLAVIDNPLGGETLAAAMQKAGAVAGVNGGYFHADWTPVGLEISAGKIVHPFERAKLLTGVLVISGGDVLLLRASEFWSRKKNWDHALQAGPFLIDHGKVVAGLDDTRRAFRTAVVADANPSGNESDIALMSRLVVCEPVTLAEFAKILATRLITGTHTVERALNLDGGSSTGMWVRGHENAPVQIGNPNVNVRNYLAILPRSRD